MDKISRVERIVFFLILPILCILVCFSHPCRLSTLPRVKHLAVDWGARRIGLATSDEAGRLAFPFSVRARDSFAADVAELLRVARGVGAQVVVFGWPAATEAERTPERQKREAELKRAAKMLEKLARESDVTLQIEWQDERNSTREVLTGLRDAGVSQRRAREELGQNGTDARAAAVILQTFLDRNSLLSFAEEESR